MSLRSMMNPAFMRVPARAMLFTLTFAATPCSTTSAVLAQTASIETIAGDMSGDRARHLIEGAKREGELSLYSTMPVDDNTAVVSAFEAKYRIKIKVWRGGSEEIRQRVLTETAGRMYQVDAVFNTGLALEPLRREGILQKVPSPYRADLVPAAAPEHQEWVGAYLNAMVQIYNTNLVKKDELPTSYGDLLD